jgi:N-acetylglucosaminyldiphosphoundecaprenol N-acetyl-beta-D-mannosaminyltransferase
MSNSVVLMGLELDDLSERQVTDRVLDDVVSGRGGWLVNPNVDVLRQIANDSDLMELTRRADLAIADGMPLIWASRLQKTPLAERVPGRQLIWTMCDAAASLNVSVFLLGGESGVAEEAAAALTRESSNLSVVGTHCPPHGFERDERCIETIIAELDGAKPGVVFCGLGFPKQERLMAFLAERFPSTWFIGSGASLTMAAGRVKCAPNWMQGLGLEWLFRLVQEPRRLFSRYVVHDLPFACRLLLASARIGASGPMPGRKTSSALGSEVGIATERGV